MTKHTPVPWKACKSHEDFNGPYWELDADDIAELTARPYTSIESAEEIVSNANDLFEFKPGDAEFIVKACNSYDKSQQAMSIALRTINDTLRHELLTDGGRDALIAVGVELKGLIEKEAGR